MIQKIYCVDGNLSRETHSLVIDAILWYFVLKGMNFPIISVDTFAN